MPGSQSRRGVEHRAFDVFRMVETTSHPALATDEQNCILAFNRAAEELLGHAAESVVGGVLDEVIEPRDVVGNRASAAGIHQMVRGGEPIQAFEIDARSASGGRVRVLVSVLPVLGPEPSRYRLVYHLLPRRRRRRAEEAIDLLVKQGDEVADAANDRDRGAGTPGAPRLTVREREVLQKLAEGRDNAEIARLLHVSVNTVRSHSRNILRKLGARGRTEAISVAFRRGLV